MNRKYWSFWSISAVLLLAACQAVPQAAAPATLPPAATPIPLPTVRAASPTMPASAVAETPAALVPVADASTPTGDSQAAEKTVQDYFAALQAGDPKTAAGLLSTFSLTHDGITRGDAADAIQALQLKGVQWSALQVKDSQMFDGKTMLVHVIYQLATPDSKTGKPAASQQDELWPVRLENGVWRYNRGNLIDFHTLDVDAQTKSGLTIKPRSIDRYSDHLSLILLAQNATNDAVVWGLSTQVLATFHFPASVCGASATSCAQQAVEAVNSQIIIDRLRSYPGVTIQVKGLFTAYPEKVDLVKYKNFSGGPLFTFALGS
jgi:hypothetical protein